MGGKKGTTAVRICLTAMKPRSLVVTIRGTCHLNPQGTNDTEDARSRYTSKIAKLDGVVTQRPTTAFFQRE
jgi:hypothetical protein